MRRGALFLLVVFAFCKSPQPGASRTSSLPGHGAISISVVPNPIVAQHISGDTYEFPFDVVVRETGGRSVTVSRVTVDVYGPAGVRLASVAWDAASIASNGYSTNLPANGERRYHFNPRKSVPSDSVFNGTRAEVRVDAYDETGTPASATTVVTATK